MLAFIESAFKTASGRFRRPESVKESSEKKRSPREELRQKIISDIQGFSPLAGLLGYAPMHGYSSSLRNKRSSYLDNVVRSINLVAITDSKEREAAYFITPSERNGPLGKKYKKCCIIIPINTDSDDDDFYLEITIDKNDMLVVKPKWVDSASDFIWPKDLAVLKALHKRVKYVIAAVNGLLSIPEQAVA